MCDFSMCRDDECPSRLTCLRFMATPSEHLQRYLVAPRKAGEERCYAYWEMEDGAEARGYDCEWARPATDDDMRAVRIRSARARIEKAVCTLSDDDALKVAAFIKSLEAQE